MQDLGATPVTRQEFVAAMCKCYGKNEDVDFEALWQKYLEVK